MIILGIDPGVACMGYGVVEFGQPVMKCLAYGVVRTKSTEAGTQRLRAIHQGTLELIDCYHPDQMAVERLFFNTNSRTAMIVGEARGAVLLAAALSELPVWEYTPLEVKQSVVGYGRAPKAQIQQMVAAILGLKEIPSPDDAADALGLCITHWHSANSPLPIRKEKRL